jgi:hypothetical protein
MKIDLGQVADKTPAIINAAGRTHRNLIAFVVVVVVIGAVLLFYKKPCSFVSNLGHVGHITMERNTANGCSLLSNSGTIDENIMKDNKQY